MDTLETFIVKSQAKFGNKFDFSKSVYIKSKEPITIICPIHGEFTTTPSTFLSSKFGCKKCYNDSKKDIKFTTEEWIQKAKEIHNDKYSYEHTVYEGSHKTITVTCPIHGDFEQIANVHINGRGCPECGKIKMGTAHKLTREQFIKRASDIHNNKYDYSLVNYQDIFTAVTIICPEHGPFKQTPNAHLNGQGYPECGKESRANSTRKSLNDFIEEANLIHNNKYDYSKVNYVNNKTNVTVICPEHGEFQTIPLNHLHGVGCPKCNSSSGENIIINYLNTNNIKYYYQYTIPISQEINPSGKGRVDFYIPDLNMFIEYHGRQHYMPVECFGGKLRFDQYQIPRDKYVEEYCQQNQITLVLIKYDLNYKQIIEKLDEIFKNRTGS